MTGVLASIITADDQSVRDQSIEKLCGGLTTEQLLAEAARLDSFRKQSDNLYHRVRALFFLSAIHRFFLPPRLHPSAIGLIPYGGYEHLLQRRHEEAIRDFLAAQEAQGPSESLSSALAAAYKGLGFQTLADQVRHSVRSVRGNQWMFRVGHELDYPLTIRPELLETRQGVFPVLAERTPVRMDLSHSGWSDIFFLGMDFPEGARVLNISVDLSVRGTGAGAPKPPVEAYLRVIDEPVLRLVSVDLNAQAEISSLAEVFDFARDYLGLLKAAVIASGIIPPGLEGSGRSLSGVLARLTGKPALGLEIVSKVNDIPKGSRLAVSTNLLACLITACMRATSQIAELTGGLREDERRLVAARAILGEWLGGSGGGWQDSGGVWPGIKLIQGVLAQPGDVEYGVSRGCLLPVHKVMETSDVSQETRRRLQDSLVLVHGGMAQDVGPVLEMVTEKYLLRSQAEWHGRQNAIGIFDEVVEHLRHGDIARIGDATQRNFDGPIQSIIPWAANHYTDTLIRSVRSEFGDRFHGFWMLGGMAGGGMGFLFHPSVKTAAQERMASIMSRTKAELVSAVPFAMEPVVYDFAVNGDGTTARLLHGADALLPAGYYTLVLPKLLRQEARAMPGARRSELHHFAVACQTRPDLAGTSSVLIDHLLPREQSGETGGAGSLDRLLEENGFDRIQHEQIRADLRAGRIGLAHNTLPSTGRIEDVRPHEVTDARTPLPQMLALEGARALGEGALAIVSLAGGVGSRWTKGAGVVKAITPFCRMADAYRTFVEIHLAKSRRTSRQFDAGIPHIFTTSYMTHDAIREHLERCGNYGYEAPLYLSPGRNIGLRLIPMVRDLRFAWEEMPQQVLDEQKQKVRESARGGLIAWAQSMGEGNDYRDNLASQCLHPVGHWYEVPNLLLNGVLARLLAARPQLKHLLLHNIDTLGANVDPAILGAHIESGATLTTEVIPRVVEDRGGGLARVDGRVRLVEGLALPSERIEFDLSFYNSGTMWIHIDKLLGVFGLTRHDLQSRDTVAEAVRTLASRMPTYVTLKDVKKRWGKGQEDIYPVTQFEKLWGDMTALPEVDARFVAVPRTRGQQLKEAGQLDGWMRDGSAAAVEALCEWN
jgi:hypothetical protein